MPPWPRNTPKSRLAISIKVLPDNDQWILELLMAPCYATLRNCIFATDKERVQFRSLVVNNVMATDIFDKELGALRKARWEKAFAKTTTMTSNSGNHNLADESLLRNPVTP
jgi:hypothetical protein